MTRQRGNARVDATHLVVVGLQQQRLQMGWKMHTAIQLPERILATLGKNHLMLQGALCTRTQSN